MPKKLSLSQRIQAACDFYRRAKSPYRNGNLFRVTQDFIAQTETGGEIRLKKNDQLLFQSMTLVKKPNLICMKFLWEETPVYITFFSGYELHNFYLLTCEKWQNMMEADCVKITEYYHEAHRRELEADLEKLEHDAARSEW